jgi:hypothetical protein
MFDTGNIINAPDFLPSKEGSPEAVKYFGAGLCAREAGVLDGCKILDTGCLMYDA